MRVASKDESPAAQGPLPGFRAVGEWFSICNFERKTMRNSMIVSNGALGLMLLLATACGPAVTPQPKTAEELAHAVAAPPSEPPAAEATEPCAGGAIKDDGSVETGYGYVPSANMGQYVQEFHSDELGSGEISKVCICWLRSRADSDLDFEVVFYEAVAGRPVDVPYATAAAAAAEVPKGVPEAGRFYEVDISDVTVPEGTSFIGVRWDPSASTFFFVCTDTSDETELVNVFSMEDRSPRWTNVINSPDPIFSPHRAVMLRAVAEP